MTTKKLTRWMPMFWSDYWDDTADLSCAQHGAYLNLIGECWMRSGLLPTEDAKLWRMARADGPKHWQQIKGEVLAKFFAKDGGYRHKRVDLELTKQAIYHDRQSTKGKNGAASRWAKARGARGNGGEGGPPVADREAQALPVAQKPIAQPVHRQWPSDGTLALNTSPLTPPQTAEPVRRPPAGRPWASGGLAIGLKRIEKPDLSPEEFQQQQQRVIAECVAAGLLPGDKS